MIQLLLWITLNQYEMFTGFLPSFIVVIDCVSFISIDPCEWKFK